MAPGSTISKGSLVGRGSTVEAGARLDRCAVGGDCHIGRGAVLQSSCLHAHVRVDDGCQVASALLADHVVVRSHAKLEVRLGLQLGVHLLADTAQLCPSHIAVRHASHCASLLPCCEQAGVVLAKRVVIDTAHTVPAGTTVSLAQQSQGGSTGSDEETDWPGAGGQRKSLHTVSGATVAPLRCSSPVVAVPWFQ